MSKQILVRKMYDSFVPVDESNLELMESFKIGGIYKATFTQPRNIGFHRKFFALLDMAFDSWEHVPVFFRGAEIAANKEEFRSNIIILSGHGFPVFNVRGEVRYKAKSISFASMSQEEFEVLYSAVVDTILREVLTKYTKDDIDNVVNELLGFT